MSSGYSVFIPGTTATIEADTKGKVKVLPYPNEKYAHEMCLVEYRGHTIETCRSGDELTTLIYRANVFEFDSFVRTLRRAYPRAVSIRYVG